MENIENKFNLEVTPDDQNSTNPEGSEYRKKIATRIANALSIIIAGVTLDISQGIIGEAKFEEANSKTVETINSDGNQLAHLQDLYAGEVNDLVKSFFEERKDFDTQKTEYAKRWPLGNPEFNNPADSVPHTQPVPIDSITNMETLVVQIEGTHLLDRLEATLPENWLKNVSSIKQVSVSKEVPESYGLGEGWVTLADARLIENGKTRIVLYKPTKKQTIKDNFATVYHEIGHANDWSRSRELSLHERIVLLGSITKRINASDRYRSTYVESIENKNKKEEMYLKAVEYWAEIVSVYLTNPHHLRIEDAEIVARYIQK